MHGTFRSDAWGQVARIAILAVGLCLLAGCVADYVYVQPGADGGGYYTRDEPYSGQGYDDDYGTGPYYPGTSGYGYYNGTSPYSGAFGWDGGDYGDYGYWPSFTFNLGISNVWDFPGYWGPWYTTGFPVWGCWHRDCDHHHHRRNHHPHHDRHDAVAIAPQSWLKPDSPLPPRRQAHDFVPSVPMRTRSAEGFANRRPLPAAAFAPHDFVRAPDDRLDREHFMGMPARPMALPRVPVEPGFANQRAMSVRQDFHAAPQPIARPAPAARVAPARQPSARSDASRTRIP